MPLTAISRSLAQLLALDVSTYIKYILFSYVSYTEAVINVTMSPVFRSWTRCWQLFHQDIILQMYIIKFVRIKGPLIIKSIFPWQNISCAIVTSTSVRVYFTSSIHCEVILLTWMHFFITIQTSKLIHNHGHFVEKYYINKLIF